METSEPRACSGVGGAEGSGGWEGGINHFQVLLRSHYSPKQGKGREGKKVYVPFTRLVTSAKLGPFCKLPHLCLRLAFHMHRHVRFVLGKAQVQKSSVQGHTLVSAEQTHMRVCPGHSWGSFLFLLLTLFPRPRAQA